MAQPSKRNPPRPQPAGRNAAAQPKRTQPSGAPELIDPRWILKALGIVFGIALLLAWGTLCLLWYQGQWQLVLHPLRKVAATPASVGLKFTELHFADDATGQPQLDGWMIPSDRADAPTALVLHGADGALADALPRAVTLHEAHLNVLVFDYRGYGRSVGQHPTQVSMEQDAEAALGFLTSTGHVAAQNVVVYGEGVGASVAVHLAAQHREVAAVILDGAQGDLTERVLRDAHSFLVPVRMLFHETFPLAEPLRTLRTPKLLITHGAAEAPAALANAADPKVTVELPSTDEAAETAAIERFVDQYVSRR